MSKYLSKYGIWEESDRPLVAGSGGALEHCQGGERSNGGLPLYCQVGKYQIIRCCCSLQCTMCCLYSIFSSQPNKLRPTVKVVV